MLPYFQNGSAASGASGPAVFTANTGATFLWAATARDFTAGTNQGVNVSLQSARTATTCYMRGLKEQIEIQTSTGLPWQWRRICFTSKGGTFNGNGVNLELETSSGEQRLLYNLNSGSTTDNALLNVIRQVVFRGVYGIDWTTPLNAAVDPTRVTLKYDKTIMVSSGNASGKLKLCKMWHPMNSNLVYDDDESGAVMTTAKYSTDARVGMGDYYVLDFIVGGIGGTTSDSMSFSPSSTLYWHEK